MSWIEPVNSSLCLGSDGSSTSLNVDIDALSINAVVFSSLCGLFGIYLVLFVLTIWASFRYNERSHKRMRTITIVLFVILCTHFVTRSLLLWQTRTVPAPEDETLKWIVPTRFLGGMTTTLAGFVSDGLLAWRFYVVYNRRWWALYIPAVAVVLNGLLGLSGDFQHFTIYRNPDLYDQRIWEITLQISAAWGWFTFSINTIMTGSILGKIFYTARRNGLVTRQRSGIVLEAIVESALVTWIGLLLYEITTFAPTGHISSNYNAGYATLCILPVFFGISQVLISVRLCFALEVNTSDNRLNTVGIVTLPNNYGHSGDSKSSARGITITVHRDVEVAQSEEASIASKEETLT